MPITAWICKGCGNREVPLDHFATTVCGERVVHPDYAAAILADRAGQPAKDGYVRVTVGLGCPRKQACADAEGYAANPLDFNAALTGTAWHAMMERGATDGAEIEVVGEIAGIKLVGHFDRLRNGIIEDHKHIKTWNLKWKKQDGADAAYVAQVSIYAELLRQMGQPKPERAIVWYHTTDEGFYPVPVDLLEPEEALAVRPYDCEYTALELYKQAQMGDWRKMPLAGKSIKFGGKSGCDFCAVREHCTVAAMGEAF